MQEVLDVVPVIDSTVESDSKGDLAAVTSPRSIPTVIEAEAEAPAIQENKLEEGGKRRKEVPTQPGVMRYLTFRIKELPPVRLLSKNDPMVTVWDTYLECYAGTTEVKPQTYNPEFEVCEMNPILTLAFRRSFPFAILWTLIKCYGLECSTAQGAPSPTMILLGNSDEPLVILLGKKQCKFFVAE